MLDHRLQILLDESQYLELEGEARRCRVSVASIIREAVDRRLEDSRERRRSAWQHVLAAEPAPVPDDPRDLKREFLEDRERKFDKIDRRMGIDAESCSS